MKGNSRRSNQLQITFKNYVSKKKNIYFTCYLLTIFISIADCLLEQLFYWVVTLNTCRVTVDGDMSDESRVSSNEVAICFYPKKEEFWLRRWTLSCRVKGFLELIGQNLSVYSFHINFPKFIEFFLLFTES